MNFKKIRVGFKKNIKFYQALYSDKRTPKIAKFFLYLAIAYFFMPFDIIPDFIPVLGYLDDIIVIPLLIYFAIKFIPADLYIEQYQKNILCEEQNLIKK